MNHGKMYMDGTPQEVFQNYHRLEEVGLAAPQVTYIMEALKQRGFPVRGTTITLQGAKAEILRALRERI